MKKKAAPEFVDSPWKSRLERMKKHQQKNSKNWKRNEQLIFGSDEKGNNEIAYGWGLYQGLLTQIYINNPSPIVESYAAEGREVARKVQEILRYDISQMGLKDLGNLLIGDVFTCGYGAITEVVETNKSTVRYPDVSADGKVTEVEEERTDEQNYVAQRIAPRDLLVDPQAKLLDLSDARYIAVAFYPTIKSLKDDGRFDLPDKLEFFPESSSKIRAEKRQTTDFDDPAGSTGEKDEDYRTICVFEIWDQVGGKVIYMTEQSNHILYEMDKWPVRFNIGGKKLFPVTIMAMHPQAEGWYPKAEIDLIAPQLIEMNAIEAMMREDSTTKRRVWAVMGGIVKPDQLAKLNDIGPGKRNRVVQFDFDKIEELLGGKIDNFHQLDLRNLLVQLDEISMAKDLPVRHQMLEANISHIIGYGPAQRGGVPSTRSAREAMLMAQKQQEKLNKRVDAIDSFNAMFYAKHIMLLQQTLDVKRYTKIVDEVSGIADYFQYSATDIQGQFRFDVIPGSAGPKTSQMKQQSEQQLFQIVAPILQAEGQSVRIAFERLARAHDWNDVDQLWKGVKAEAKAMAAMLFAFQKGAIKPEALIEQAAKLVNAELSQPELMMVKKQLEGQQGGQGQPPAQPGMQGESTASRRQMPEGM